MSEVEQEQTQEQEVGEPDEQPTPIQAPDDDELAEHEEADEHEQQESEQVEGIPEEPQALNEKQLEALFGKLDREKKRHDGRVREILGADAEALIDCPLCDLLTPGYVLPMQDTPERFPAVREFMGDAQPRQLKHDPNTRTCQTCDGEGMVDVGSKVPDQKELVCTDCGGKGWQGSRAPVSMAGPTSFTPPPEANGQGEPTPIRDEPAEAAALRAAGYTLIPPVGASA